MSGWIKLHRQLIDWEWYLDANVMRLFLHLLLTVNYEDKQWKGMLIKRGSRVFKTEKLGAEIGLERQPTRTCLDKLKSTSSVTIQKCGNLSIISITNFEKFQQDNQQNSTASTSDQPANQPAINQHTKEYKNIRSKEVKNKERDTCLISDDGYANVTQASHERHNVTADIKILDIKREDINIREIEHHNADAISEEILSASARSTQNHNLVEKKAFGEFGNVTLSKAQFDMLKNSYDDEYILSMITEVDCWLENNPKEKKKTNRNDYARIKTFINNDRKWKEQRNAAR